MEKFVVSVVLAMTVFGNIYASEEDGCITDEAIVARLIASISEEETLAVKRIQQRGEEFTRLNQDTLIRKERHRMRCEKMSDGIKKCVREMNYKGKFTLSIANSHEEHYVDMGPDFYAEIINGESDKGTLTEEEIKSMHDTIYEYITGTGINGMVKIGYLGKQLFDGWWTTTGY